MPADADDYARRQQISSLQQKHGAAQQCPAGCVSTQQQQQQLQQQPVAADRQQQHHHHQDGVGCGRRYASEKNLLETVANAERDHFGCADHFGSDRGCSDHFGSDRGCSDHFGSERGSSDRLPSGERYQGVSERFPLGERPQTSVSTDRLFSSKDLVQGAAHCQNDRTAYHPERYNFERTNCPRYPDRYTPVLDRYGGHSTLDRYPRTATPTERYHTLSSADKERNHPNDRYPSLEKYQSGTVEMDRYKSPKQQDVHKTKERSSSSDRKERERMQREHYQGSRYEFGERFPTIPCPERFATADRSGRPEKVSFSQVSYLEPPSPAPASDRFIPPPPLSPEGAPSPDCFPNNTFPSPTTATPERFIPPPPLSPSPTDAYSPSPKKPERYDKIHKYHHNDHRFNSGKEYRYHQNYHAAEKYLGNEGGRFGDRYVPPNAHVPVDRYVPQQQEPYYNTYQSYGFKQFASSTDPYMRRDLAFHYRLPLPYTTSNHLHRMRYQQQMGTPGRVKCCQYQDGGYQLSKSSPGSSSSSSMTSQGKDFHQCVDPTPTYPNHCNYQQEKGTQCGALQQCQQGKECPGFVSPNLRAAKGGQCRHSVCVSPSVEYVGASGGRHVCATPPPRGSIGSADGSVCNEGCCSRRSQGSITVTVW